MEFAITLHCYADYVAHSLKFPATTFYNEKHNIGEIIAFILNLRSNKSALYDWYKMNLMEKEDTSFLHDNELNDFINCVLLSQREDYTTFQNLMLYRREKRENIHEYFQYDLAYSAECRTVFYSDFSDALDKLLCAFSAIKEMEVLRLNTSILENTINKILNKPYKLTEISFVEDILANLDASRFDISETTKDADTTMLHELQRKLDNAFEIVSEISQKTTLNYFDHNYNLGNHIKVREELKFKTLQAFFNYGVTQLIKNNQWLKKCENCGKYFYPSSRSDEKYCNNVFKNGKTCRQLGYEIKINNDELLKTYRSAYKTANGWKNRNKNNVKDVDALFDNWHKSAKEKLRQAQNGDISIDDYKQWFKNNNFRNYAKKV